MKEVDFHRLSLALPIVVPLLGIPFLLLTRDVVSRDTPVLLVFSLLVLIGLAAVVPYVVFAGIALATLGSRPATTWRRFVWTAPLIFAGILFAIRLPLDFPTANVGPPAVILQVGVPIGYGYVLLATAIRLVLRRAGVIAP